MSAGIRVIYLLTWLQLLLMAGVNLEAAGEQARPETTPTPTTEATLETAPVEIDGEVLFRVRGASSYPAAQRAAAISKRIEAVAADPSLRSDSLRVDDSDNAAVIVAGNDILMLVTDFDAKLEMIGREYLAQAHLQRIQKAIEDYRRARSSEALLRGGGYALAATAVLALCIALLFFLERRLDKMLKERVKSRIHDVGIQSFEILRAEHIWKALHGLLFGAGVAAAVVLLLVYLHFVLALFPWTRGLANRLFDLVTQPLGQMGKAIIAVIPDLIILAILFFLFRFALRLLRHFFDAVQNRNVALAGFEPEWAFHTYKLVRLMVVAFGVIVAYPYIPGSQSAAFKGISIFIGVVFSLGSSTAVSNLIAGYLITYRRVFKLGDRVQVGDVVGTVIAMRLQVTHLLSPKHEEVTIPNSQILNGNVVNFSSMAREKGVILHTEVGIGYETPWRQVEAMLIQAARSTPGLLNDPPPFTLIKRLGDFAVVYELNVHCDRPLEMDRIYTELHRRVLDVFNQYGVQIMTPAYEGDTAEPKVVARDQWFAPPAAATGEGVIEPPSSPPPPTTAVAEGDG